MILAAKSDLSLVFAIFVCNTRQSCQEEVKWKLASDVILSGLIICIWHLHCSVNIVERLQGLKHTNSWVFISVSVNLQLWQGVCVYF